MIDWIDKPEQLFCFHTAHTTYAIRVTKMGHLENFYYGRRIHTEDADGLIEQQRHTPGNMISYSEDAPEVVLEDMCLEQSGCGKGDIREPLVEIEASDGSRTTDFVFEAAVKVEGDLVEEDLPHAYGSDDHLMITLRDCNHNYIMELHYLVFEKTDVITRTVRFINSSPEEVKLTRLLSMQLDLREKGLCVHSFSGGWIKEMCHHTTTLNAGKMILSSVTGTSSNRMNPFFMVSRENTSEENGDCFAFNLIYSGNHYEAVEVSGTGKTRIVNGINPAGFSYKLKAQESFFAPEAVLSFSSDGYTGISRNMHAFVREHIVRGTWKKKERPVVINSWEAGYFDYNERSLLSLAKKAKEAGVEMFVLDDGWFGERSDDSHSLGDWIENKKKFPNGLLGFSTKLLSMGLSFGIWIEPEMVNTDSVLYRAHPEWTMDIPEMAHSEGRHQRILDMANPEVVSYIADTMTKLLTSAKISYVKWDMNRIFSDCYSKYLGAERQGECAHRYMIGVYHLMRRLTECFPEILFEGCASGGNRFDLGTLCYFPQIWASDNTDAISRLRIQDGYSYGYPQSVFTAHVSDSPNHQTLRKTSLATRFAVAAFGILGYECNFNDMSKNELEEIKEQIALYKKYRKELQFGTFYRHRSGNVYEWSIVSDDKKTAWGLLAQKEVMPGERYADFHAKGLMPEVKYHFCGQEVRLDVSTFGELINNVTPVHINTNSAIFKLFGGVAQVPGETEDHVMYGDALMYAGVRLREGYAGNGFDDHVRLMTDNDTRLYIMEALNNS